MSSRRGITLRCQELYDEVHSKENLVSEVFRPDHDELYFQALDLEKEGDFVGSFKLLTQGAALGDSSAQNALSIAYDSGIGVEKDKTKAIFWFKKAWRTEKQTGYCLNIALTYAEIGQRRRAIHWWNKAIALGDGSAALSFAKFLMKTNKSRMSSRVIDLLKMAANSQESWQISLEEKEEAGKLLEKMAPHVA